MFHMYFGALVKNNAMILGVENREEQKKKNSKRKTQELQSHLKSQFPGCCCSEAKSKVVDFHCISTYFLSQHNVRKGSIAMERDLNHIFEIFLAPQLL